MQNNKKHQTFRVVNNGVKIFVAGFITWSFLPFISGNDRELTRRNHEMAESLGYQILQIHSSHLKNPAKNPPTLTERGPASVASPAVGPEGEDSLDWSQWRTEGEMGTDPWGDAYAFKMIKNASGEIESIQVWSRNSPDKVLLKVK